MSKQEQHDVLLFDEFFLSVQVCNAFILKPYVRRVCRL